MSHGKRNDGEIVSRRNEYYNVTVNLKCKEKTKFIRKSKQSVMIHVSGDSSYDQLHGISRNKFNLYPKQETYLASNKGRCLSYIENLYEYLESTNASKKHPTVYLHYVQSYSHFLWEEEKRTANLDEGLVTVMQSPDHYATRAHEHTIQSASPYNSHSVVPSQDTLQDILDHFDNDSNPTIIERTSPVIGEILPCDVVEELESIDAEDQTQKWPFKDIPSKKVGINFSEILCAKFETPGSKGWVGDFGGRKQSFCY